MQFLFNLLYELLSITLSTLGFISAPSWFTAMFESVAEFVIIFNYYIPLDSAVVVIIFVISTQIALMVVSAILQLF